MRKMVVFCFAMGFVLFTNHKAAAQSAISSEQFAVKFSGSGIASLKYPHDIYDTEYINPGAILGDVMVHYRIGKDKWHEAWVVVQFDFLSPCFLERSCLSLGHEKKEIRRYKPDRRSDSRDDNRREAGKEPCGRCAWPARWTEGRESKGGETKRK